MSGFYFDDCVNLGMMEVVCKVVDKVIEELVRFLYKILVMKSFLFNLVELE